MSWNSTFKVAGREIGLNTPTYFIADIAANHDGDLERAKKLVQLAKEAGADCAKFQHFVADKIVSARGFAKLGSNQAHQASWKKSVVEVYDQYHFRREWTAEVARTCAEAGIDFMTTPYDTDAIELVRELVPAFKIGSGDITWPALIETIGRIGKPVFLATGAADMADVEAAVEAALGVTRDVMLMQCNTNYTGSLENFRHVNLKVLQAFALRWPNMPLGLSDHTPGHSAVLGAVTLGARAIEKHFTDDTTRTGPDHAFALDPRTWRAMVNATRELELALGTGVKIVEDNEAETVVVQRRAIRLKRPVTAGTVLSADDLECLRPCPPDAIDPRHWNAVLGRQVVVDKAHGDEVRWADLG
jgi:sialic acid synthase SpsE